MELTKDSRNIENGFTSLIGRPVLKVEYQEKEPTLQEPTQKNRTDQTGFNIVAGTIRLFIAPHIALEIYWNTIQTYFDKEFLNYGIKARLVKEQAIAQERTCNMSGESLWKDVIGQTITDITYYTAKTWVESPKTGVQMDFSYPKTLAVTFSNNKVVYISTEEYSAGHRYYAVRGVTGLVVTTKGSIAD